MFVNYKCGVTLQYVAMIQNKLPLLHRPFFYRVTRSSSPSYRLIGTHYLFYKFCSSIKVFVICTKIAKYIIYSLNI